MTSHGEIRRSQPEVARLVARARNRRTHPTAADDALDIADELARAEEDFALRLVRRLVQRLEASTPQEAAALLRDRPLTGSARWDALIAGAVAWICRERGLPAPAWSQATPLSTFWFVRPEPQLRGRLIQETPHELAVLGIWLDAASLRGL